MLVTFLNLLCYNEFHKGIKRNKMIQDQIIPPKLAEIVSDFNLCVGHEKLEYLLEFSEKLPALPKRLEEKHQEMQEVHECLTPVFVYGELEAGKMVYYFDAPPESPTVRGFASILMEGINHAATPAEILRIPDTFYLDMGFQKVLSGQRLNGMSAFLGYMKRIAKNYI